MAYENIQITRPNFCVGPQAGTFCSLDASGASVVVRVKNSAGTLVDTLALYSPSIIIDVEGDYSSYPHNEITAIKYVGPTNVGGFYDDMLFFTIESIISAPGVVDGFVLRKWLMDSGNNRLNLQASYTNLSDITNYLDCYDFAVEHTHTTLTDHALPSTPGIIKLPTTSGISVKDTIILGPSTDASNTNAMEHCYVFSVDSDTQITVKSYGPSVPPVYEYKGNATPGLVDPVTIVKDVYVFSSGSATASGAIYKLDGASDAYYGIIDKHESNIYDGVIAVDWNDTYYGPSFVKSTEMLTIQTSDYEVIKSHTLKNIASDKTISTVYSISMLGNTLYRLQSSVNKWADDGIGSTTNWATYNYVEDTLVPYVSSINVSNTNEAYTITRLGQVFITVKVRDQFGVSVLGKNIQFNKSGDLDATFDPSNGQVVTDSNGEAIIEYNAGANYTGDVAIDVRSDGSNTFLGSQYVWVKTVFPMFSSMSVDGLVTQVVLDPSTIVVEQQLLGPEALEVKQDAREVAAIEFEQAFLPYLSTEFPASTNLKQVAEYLNFRPTSYTEAEAAPEVPETKVIQEAALSDTGTVDQTYISRHYSTAHIDTATLNQFVFIQEVRPPFFSEKNGTDTDIWVRMRPFATSLDPNTLVFKIREASYAGDTGWQDITDDGTITLYDAGGGLNGVEFQWYPATSFHHNAIVYVSIEIYDTSPQPNRVVVDYWFKVIPDFKKPYIDNLFPGIEEHFVPIDTDISFDIHDDGSGVDIDTLEVLVNYTLIVPTTITKVNDQYYQISYTPPSSFDYSDSVSVEVTISDVSDNENTLHDAWNFYTTTSTEPWIDSDNFYPGRCIKGLPRNYNGINFQVYGVEAGVDVGSIEVYVGGVSRNVIITPIVYRLN